MIENHSVSSRRPSGKSNRASGKNRRSSRSYAILLLIAPLCGIGALLLLLLLFAQILSKTADPDALLNPCVFSAVFISGGICGKIAAKSTGKPFPWCILSCILFACYTIPISFAFGLCSDSSALFKGAVLAVMTVGGICFAVTGSKKERRPRH